MYQNKFQFDVLNKFYKGKKVLITGSTGFKGSWLSHILIGAGADVTGYALEPSTDPNLFSMLELNENQRFHQVYGDIRNLNLLMETLKTIQPEIVFHLAAQPIVRDSFRDPIATYSINVMGTVNICEAIRQIDSVKSFINVTTDKVYRNNEWEWGYRETDFLDGYDPYSNSKSCSELVTHSYKKSFFESKHIRISTARAGNVIGGGDFSPDRIIPDCVKTIKVAKERGRKHGIIGVRNPDSIRPYEHVLEPLFAYMLIAKAQYEDEIYAGCYNVGPDDMDCITTRDLVTLFCDTWGKRGNGVKISWENRAELNAPHEANFLKLDCSKLKAAFSWRPTWHIDTAIEQTVIFTDIWLSGKNIVLEMDREIKKFIDDALK